MIAKPDCSTWIPTVTGTGEADVFLCALWRTLTPKEAVGGLVRKTL